MKNEEYVTKKQLQKAIIAIVLALILVLSVGVIVLDRGENDTEFCVMKTTNVLEIDGSNKTCDLYLCTYDKKIMTNRVFCTETESEALNITTDNEN